MDLAALRLLIDVAKAGSFAAVARTHDVDPSLISRRIARLEEDVGFRLFQRTTRKISLTESGRRFVDTVATHLDAIEDAKQVSRDLSEQPRGLLRVSASSAFGYAVLVPLLSEFRALVPDVRLELLLTDRRIDLIDEGVDVAIRLGTLDDSRMIARRIMPVAFRLYVSRQVDETLPRPNTIAGLATVDCLTYPGSDAAGLVHVETGDGQEPVRLSGRIAISNALALKKCAIDGIGPALLPDWLVTKELASGTLVDWLPNWSFAVGKREPAAWFVYPSKTYLPLKVRRFMDFIDARLSE